MPLSRRSLLGLIACSLSCGGRAGSELLTDLREQTKTLGLALIYATASTFEVLPFDKRLIHYQNPSGWVDQAWATPDGRHLIWLGRSACWLSTLDGQHFASVAGRFLGVQAIAASPDLSMVALETASVEGNEEIPGLHILHFGSGTYETVLREPGSERYYLGGSGGLGWSSDGHQIVYGRDGEIRILDLETATSTTLAKGSCPTWSPNGNWIAFAGPEGQATLWDVASGQFSNPMPDRVIRRGLHWSPDSRYLLFSANETATLSTNLSSLWVLRPEDLAVVEVLQFGFKGGTDHNWGWIYDYPSFCSDCAQY